MDSLSLMRRQQLPALSSEISHELVQHIERMHRLTEVAKEGMNQLSEVYAYGEYKVVTTLAAGEILKRMAQFNGSLTADQTAAYDMLRQQYLEQMSIIAGSAGAQIINDIVNAPLEDEGKLSQLLHGMFGLR